MDIIENEVIISPEGAQYEFDTSDAFVEYVNDSLKKAESNGYIQKPDISNLLNGSWRVFFLASEQTIRNFNINIKRGEILEAFSFGKNQM